MKTCKGKNGPHQYNGEKFKQCPKCKEITDKKVKTHIVRGIIKTCRKGHKYPDSKNRCPQCKSDASRAWKLRNPDKAKPKANARAKKWQRNNPEKNILRIAKSSAKARGIEFSISIQDIIIPDICPILKIPLFRTDGKTGPNTPSLDRIDNSKGYIPGNVWVISLRANKIKYDATLEELEMLIEALRNLKNRTAA